MGIAIVETVLLKHPTLPGHVRVIDVGDDLRLLGKSTAPTLEDVRAALNRKLETETPSEAEELPFVWTFERDGFSIARLRTTADQLCRFPTLVATTKTHSRRAPDMSVTVKCLTGNDFAVPVASADQVYHLKERIEKINGTMPMNQRIIFNRENLHDDQVLRECGMCSGSTIHMVLQYGASGGVSPPIGYANDFHDTISVPTEPPARMPKWRGVHAGVNLEGICENASCAAFGKMVVNPVPGRWQVGLVAHQYPGYAQCPVCFTRMKPLLSAVFDSAWKCEGVRERDNRWVSLPWKRTLEHEYYRLGDDETHGRIVRESMVVIVKTLEEARAAALFRDENFQPSACTVCSICWSKMHPVANRVSTCCGRSFHANCYGVWSSWSKAREIQDDCPLCHENA